MFSMFRKMIYLASFVLVLSLVGDVQAQALTVTWTNAGSDSLWSTAENWEGGAVPTLVTKVIIDSRPGPTIANEGATAYFVRLKAVGNQPVALTVSGGTLRTSDEISLAWGSGSNAALNMISGTITIGSSLYVGQDGSGTLNMSGGTITIGDSLNIARNSTATGHVSLDGGIITTNNFVMREEAGVGTMDIMAGTLIINGDAVETVQGYIDNGWITAYEGNGTLQLDYDVTNKGKTTLKATHFLNPNPADGSNAPVCVNQLQWTLPEPSQPGGVVTCDVYFGTNTSIEANPKVVTRQAVGSVSVTLASDTTYYWALDLYDSSISTTEPFYLSPIFTFTAFSNLPPIVDAGADVATWLEGAAPEVVQLGGIVSDECGGPGPATLLWTVVAEPNESNPAQISDPLELNPTVTVREPGSYTLQLEAGDGEFTVTDTMQIVLYADACEHAKNQEGFELIPGDLNEDCIVNELDLAILEEYWLEENSSTE